VLRNPKALRKTCRVVLLVGMPGMGKTTLSFMLGGHDSDHTMVADRAKTNLPGVIATFGTPDAFIEYEGQTIIRMLQTSIAHDGTAVIATGGSAVHSAPLREFLKDNEDVVVVWLSRKPVDTDGQDWSARGVVVPSDIVVTCPEHLTNVRTPLYAAMADLELRTDMWDAQRCAVALQSAIRFFT
jgi:shikimate kinase